MPIIFDGEFEEEPIVKSTFVIPEDISVKTAELEFGGVSEEIIAEEIFLAEKIAIEEEIAIKEPRIEPDPTRIHYMSDYIEVDWAKNISSSYPVHTYYMMFEDLTDAPDLIKQKGMYDVINLHVSYISPYGYIVGGRDKAIEQAKLFLDNMGVTVLDDNIFAYNQLQRASMFAHELEGLMGFTTMKDTAVREDEEANDWVDEKSKARGDKFKTGFWVIIIVIIVALILLGIGYMYIKSFIQARFMKKAKEFTK